MKNLTIRFFVFVLLVSCATGQPPTQTPFTLIEVTVSENVPQSTSTLPPTHTFAPTTNPTTPESSATSSPPPTVQPSPTITVPSYPPPTGRIYFFWDPTPLPQTLGGPGPGPKQNLYIATPGLNVLDWSVETVLDKQLDLAYEFPSQPPVAVSPDQTKLVFAVDKDTDHDNWSDRDGIYLYDLTEGLLIPIINETHMNVGSLSWLPNSQTLVYSQDRGVWQININDLVPQELINLFPDYIGYLTWSPSGELLAMYLYDSIVFFDKETSSIITTATINQLTSPANIVWSPNSYWLASNKITYGGLVVVDTNIFEIVLSLDSGFARPAWAPDSSQLAFVERIENHSDLVIWYPGNFTTTKLLGGDHISSPIWSPDGTKLAVSVTQEGINRLVLVDVLTNEVQELLEGDVEIIKVHSWSPNGQWLLFFGKYENKRGFYIVHQSGGNACLVFEIPENTMTPDPVFWLP